MHRAHLRWDQPGRARPGGGRRRLRGSGPAAVQPGSDPAGRSRLAGGRQVALRPQRLPGGRRHLPRRRCRRCRLPRHCLLPHRGGPWAVHQNPHGRRPAGGVDLHQVAELVDEVEAAAPFASRWGRDPAGQRGVGCTPSPATSQTTASGSIQVRSSACRFDWVSAFVASSVTAIRRSSARSGSSPTAVPAAATTARTSASSLTVKRSESTGTAGSGNGRSNHRATARGAR